MSDNIEITFEDGTQTVRMKRPEKKNAITGEMYTAMAEALENAASSDDIRCTVILGVPGSFSAGNDIGDFLQSATQGPDAGRPVFRFLEALIANPKPLVAGVDGLAIGIGTTMLMHCDYVVASENSTLATPFVDLGIVPEAGSTLVAPRIMGHQKAFQLLVMGEHFSAQDAYIAGLVNRVASSDDVEAHAIETAKNIAAKPPEALKLSRDMLRGDITDVAERMRHESKVFSERLSSDEARQAFAAFMSKGAKKAS